MLKKFWVTYSRAFRASSVSSRFRRLASAAVVFIHKYPKEVTTVGQSPADAVHFSTSLALVPNLTLLLSRLIHLVFCILP